MILRSLNLAAMLCAAAACGTEAPDPQGTYQVTISATTELPFPLVFKWPVASDLTLAFDAAGHAEVTFLDSPAMVEDQSQSPDGYLIVHMHTSFPGEVLDPEMCPDAILNSNLIGVRFELHFPGDLVEGVGSTLATCKPPMQLSHSAIFFFDLSGDRVPR